MMTSNTPAGVRRARTHRRYLTAAVAAIVGFATFSAVSGANATLPLAAIESDGMTPTFGKAANGVVAEVWPAGAEVQFRTLNAGTWGASAVLAALPDGLTVRSTTAAVGVNYLGNLEVYVVASDGQAWHSFAGAGASDWSAFSSLGAPAVPIAGDVAVGTNYLGNQELYVATTEGEVFHRFSTPGEGSGWSGWDTMGFPQSGVRGSVAVGKNSLGNQELYIVGNDGIPYHNFSTPGLGSGWNGWDPLDGHIAPLGDVSVGINYVGNQELYIVGTDGMIWHNYATPGEGSGWVGWSPIGAPGSVAATGNVAVQPQDFAMFGQQWIRVIANTGVIWQETQTPGEGSGWTDWSVSSTQPAATISAVSPVSGSTHGGTSVTLTGTNFTGATAVNFGGVASTAMTVNSATSIKVTSPAGDVGDVHVTVAGAGGTSASSAADQYTYWTPGAISGTVTGLLDAPLKGITVAVSNDSTFFRASAATAADGTYLVPELAAGVKYHVCFFTSLFNIGSSTTGYLGQCFDNVASQDSTPGPTDVTVLPDATTPNIDAHLVEGGTISGTVTGVGGTALGGVIVKFTLDGNLLPISKMTTGNGTYTLNGLSAGSYTVCFSGTSYVPQCWNGAATANPTQITVVTGIVMSGIDAQMADA